MATSDQRLQQLYLDLAQMQAGYGDPNRAADAYALALYYARRRGDVTLASECREQVRRHNPRHVIARDGSAPLFFAQLLLRYPADEVEQEIDHLRRRATEPADTGAEVAPATPWQTQARGATPEAPPQAPTPPVRHVAERSPVTPVEPTPFDMPAAQSSARPIDPLGNPFEPIAPAPETVGRAQWTAAPPQVATPAAVAAPDEEEAEEDDGSPFLRGLINASAALTAFAGFAAVALYGYVLMPHFLPEVSDGLRSHEVWPARYRMTSHETGLPEVAVEKEEPSVVARREAEREPARAVEEEPLEAWAPHRIALEDAHEPTERR